MVLYPDGEGGNRFWIVVSGYPTTMDREPRAEVPQEGRASMESIEQSPHLVFADVEDLDVARSLIEELELNGVPSVSIELLGAETKDPREPSRESDVAESRAFADVAKSTIIGGSLGIVIGSLLGLLMAYLIPDLTAAWGALMGGLFGAGIGGAAGGISIVKYSSPAWDETYQVEDDATPRVAVHHADEEIVDRSEEMMRRHVGEGVTRHDDD